MSIFTKISDLIKQDDKLDSESELTQRIRLLNFSILSVILFSLLYGLYCLIFFENIVNGIIILSFFILFCSTYIIFKKTLNYNASINLTLVLLTILFFYLVYEGLGDKTSIIWGILYPVILSFLIDYKRSGYFSLGFLILNISIFVASNFIDLQTTYTTDVILRFATVYLFILLFLQFYLRIKKQVLNIKEKKTIESQQKLTEKNKFLSNLSYQIRTPLNNITGIINLQRESLNEEVVEEVELSISNLIAIVNSIPEVFEKKLTPIKGKKTYFNVNSVIKKSISLFESEKYNRLKFSLNLSNKVPAQVFGDRMLLMQIIISVIDFIYTNFSTENLKLDIISKTSENEKNKNSIKLKIRCFLKDNDLSSNLSISSADQINRNLREFDIIKDMTKSASGDLDIKNEENELTFLFTFSYSKEEGTEVIKEKKVTSKDDFFGDKKKILLKDANILLVEDDNMNSKVITLNLSKHVNKIVIAENGKEALEKYASTKIDLILMDIRMPLMDGFKTTEKIREAEQGTISRTPIIAVTANASSEVKKRCYDVGMNDYTTKPINFKILIRKMTTLLE